MIGTGAGGGTLARHLAPSGKRILLLERGDWLPREPENWSTVDVFVDGRYISPDSWYERRRASPSSSRRCITSSAAPPSCTAPRSTGCASRTSANCSHHDGLSPAWPISYQDMEPYYTAAENDLPGARRAGRGSDRAAGQRALPVPGGLPRAADPAALRRPGEEGYHPFHAPCGILVNEANLPYSICVKCGDCDGFPCPLHAKSDAEVIGVRPALEHDNVTLLRNARAVKLETNPAGTAVTSVVVERRRRNRAVRRATSWSSPAARPTPPSCCSPPPATSTRTGWPTAPTRSAATSCTTTARRCSPCRRSRTRPSSRRPSASTTSTSAARTSTTRWATSR